LNRNCRKNVFWPNIGVGPLFQVLNILAYAGGLKQWPALILSQNPIFEMAANQRFDTPFEFNAPAFDTSKGNAFFGKIR